MPIYNLTQAAAGYSELLPDTISNRTIIVGGGDLRQKFIANLAAAVSTPKGEFLQRTPTKSGKVLMVLPNHGQSQHYSNLIQSLKVSDPKNIFWTYDLGSFLAEDLSEYALVVVDELSRAFGVARGLGDVVQDVTLPQHLLTAPNLLVVNGYSEPKNGSFNTTGYGEANILDSMLTLVNVSNEYIEINQQSGQYLKLDTTGAPWKPPVVIQADRGDWI